MHKLRTDDSRPGSEFRFDNMETESIGADRPSCSGPLNRKAGKKSARFNIPESTVAAAERDADPYLEITLDVRDDVIAVHSVKPAAGIEIEDPEVTLLARKLEKKPSSLGSSLIRSASTRIRQMSQEVKKLASMKTRAGPGRVDRTKSAAAHALKGLKFISKTDGGAGWPAVEKRFDELAGDRGLSRALFGQCIGMKESKEFAGELFDALARRRNITGDSITKDELRDFWDQIADQSFDSRLQTFFDMVDKNADGRLTEEEVKEIITLSASANKLSKIQEQAEEYACLIMEELDPNNLGYIELYNLETLLLQAPAHSAHFGTMAAAAATTMTANSRNLMSQMLSQKLKPTAEPNPLYRFYNRANYFLQDNWRRVWVVALWLAICGSLFAWKFVQYRRRAVFVGINLG